MTTQLAPAPIFRGWDNNGNPLVSGQLFTYVAGTTTPQASWTDATQVTQNTNPVILNARGEASVWLDPSLTYKLALQDSAGNPIWTKDQIQGATLFSPNANVVPSVSNTFTVGSPTVSWANIYLGPNKAPAFDPTTGNILYYAQTATEVAVGATPVDFAYPPGYPERYGTNTTPGTTDMTAAVQAAINYARAAPGVVSLGATGILLVTSPLNCTEPAGGTQNGWRIVNIGQMFSGGAPVGVIHARHNGVAVFDCSGAFRVSFEGVCVTTDSSTYPKTCWLLARNSVGSSLFHNFRETFVNGKFSVAVLYNYGAEDIDLDANHWYNGAGDAGACVVVITANNFFRGTSAFLTSPFITILTGVASSIGHTFVGGEYALTNTSATGDVFYIEGGVSNFRFYGGWMMCSGGVAGHSYVYNDNTNGPALRSTIHQLKTENSATVPVHGLIFGPVASPSNNAPVSWTIQDSYFNTTTDILAAATAGCFGFDFTLLNNSTLGNQSISWPGTLSDSFINFAGTITITTSQRNVIWGALTNITITTRTNDVITDTFSGAVLPSGRLGLFGATATYSQLTGWGTPTGAAVQNNYSGSAATLAQTSAAVAEIIITLKNAGLFGA